MVFFSCQLTSSLGLSAAAFSGGHGPDVRSDMRTRRERICLLGRFVWILYLFLVDFSCFLRCLIDCIWEICL